MNEPVAAPARTATCGCGKLTATVRAEPIEVYACSCLDCQRLSGSSFLYGAIYPEGAVAITGAHKLWRHAADSGRWVENGFCPACGVTVFWRAEALPGITGISVGCFGDPHFARPTKVYWALRQHDWLRFPEGVERLERQ